MLSKQAGQARNARRARADYRLADNRIDGVARPTELARGRAARANVTQANMAQANKALVNVVQRAYRQLMSGDSVDARRTLEHVLAGQRLTPLSADRRRARPAGAAGNTAQTQVEPAAARVVIRTLGMFEVRVDGICPGSPRKPAQRPLGLLKVLIAQGGCAVTESIVVDALWPDLDGDHAHDAKQVALHRLRKLLGSGDAIAVRDGRMFIDDEQVWVDAFALEALCRSPVAGTVRERAGAALDLYKGPFLPQELDSQWTTRMRECLRAKFVNVVARAAAELEAQGDFAGAAALFERGLGVDDLDGVLRSGLVRCLHRCGSGRVSRTKK